MTDTTEGVKERRILMKQEKGGGERTEKGALQGEEG